MKSFKQIIFESPDSITIYGGDKTIGFREASYTFLIYNDLVEKSVQWAAYNYVHYELLCSSKKLHDEFYVKKSHPNYGKAVYQLQQMEDFPAHSHLRETLAQLDHYDKMRGGTILDGRLYEDNGNFYFPFWQLSLFELLNKYRHLIDDFLKKVNVPTNRVKFEDETDESIFHPYDEVFKTSSSDKHRSYSDEQRRMKQMQLDLHMKKGQLDKAIVQALQSRPKDVNTLYQRLEKEFGMPVAKIKHLYGAVPLDKLISKKAKELVRESILPADRWVGVVDHNGSVILPPNQTGDRQHYHYGLDGYQYRFSYWPHKKEVSWWSFPSDEEELAVKVEDYLIRKGYPVDRHVDYAGRKIRDTLNESMFPKDFDRHALGSCMAATALATDYLLSKGRSDFKVVEGWVSLYPEQHDDPDDFSPHTWIQFNNGKIFDPTKKQWAKWGFDPNEVRFESIKKTYTPEEYQSVCQRQPDDLSKFKKMAEATLINDEIPEKLYHATYRALLDEILSDGIIPGGKDIQNFDWSKKFVYLAETAENAISFVENAENESIPEEWLEDIVVLEVDVSKLDLTNMAPDEHWNPSVEDGDEGYQSFQYNGIVPPEAIKVL